MTPTDLVAWREALGFTQGTAARLLGMSRNQLINLETGVSGIKRSVALACGAIYNDVPPWPKRVNSSAR